MLNNLKTNLMTFENNLIDLNNFDSILNTNALFETTFLDLIPILNLLQANFTNCHVYIDSITKGAILDLCLQCLDVNVLDETSGIKAMTFLYENFYKDGYSKISTHQPLLQFLNQETLQNLNITIQYLSVDLNSVISEFSYTTSFNFITQSLSASQFDSYKDSTNFTLLESIHYIISFLLFVTFMILCEKITRIQKFQTATNSYLIRIIKFI